MMRAVFAIPFSPHFLRCFPNCSRMLSLRFPALYLGIKRLRKRCLSTVHGAGFLFGFHRCKGKTLLPQTGKTGLPLDMYLIPTRQDISVNILISLSTFKLNIHFCLYFFSSTPFRAFSVSKQYHAWYCKNSDWVYLTVYYNTWSIQISSFFCSNCPLFHFTLNSFFLANCDPHYIASAICQ